MAVTLSNVNQFSKKNHWQIFKEICNKMIIENPTALYTRGRYIGPTL